MKRIRLALATAVAGLALVASLLGAGHSDGSVEAGKGKVRLPHVAPRPCVTCW